MASTKAQVKQTEYRGNFLVGKGETIRYNLFMSRKTLAISVTLLFTATAVIRTYQLMTSGGMALFSALCSALPMALLCAVMIPAFQFSSTALSILMVYRQGRAKPFSQELVLNREGLFASSDQGTSKVVWKNLGFARETMFDFLFFYSEKNAFILPKKQMQDREAETETVRMILAAHLPKERLLLRGKKKK